MNRFHYAYFDPISLCLASIAKDPVAQANFDKAMMSSVRTLESNTDKLFGQSRSPGYPDLHPFTFPECDISADAESIDPSDEINALIFGRYPNVKPYSITEKQYSPFFPRGMATDELYPAVSSLYSDPDTGILYNSPCFRPNATAMVGSVVCPSPFLSPTTDEFIGKVNCIKPCPVQAYSDEEYQDMWSISSAPACIGLVFNIHMALTWYIGGKKAFRDVNFNLKMCVACGLLYGVIDTIPVLVLGKELPW
jgi:hypothetical protein